MQVFGASDVLLRLAKAATKYQDQLKLLSDFNTFMAQLRDGDKDAERRMEGLLNVHNVPCWQTLSSCNHSRGPLIRPSAV